MERRRHVRRRIAALLTILAVAQSAGALALTQPGMPPGAAATPAVGVSAVATPSTSETGAVRIRKNVEALTARERRDFVDAVLALKSVPSPINPELSYYDQFVQWHLGLYPCGMGHEMMRAHGGPMVLPWHRVFVLHFENALREVSGKNITVPYWDWTDPASTAAVFADDFMGGDGDPAEGFAVTTGPFRRGQWELNVHPIGLQWSASASTHLTRHFGSFPGFTKLPDPETAAWVLARPHYDVAPYDTATDPNLSFRAAVEGFWSMAGPARVPTGSMVCGPDGVMTVTSGPAMHNLVHGWVGGLLGTTPEGIKLGTMFLPTSPNDPVFFLHHANIDRLWAEWQNEHGITSYEPNRCDQTLPEVGCRANTRTDRMHPPFEATPGDVADIGTLGYRYDTIAEPGRGAPEDEGAVILEGCRDRAAFVLGVEEAVRSRVPASYELVRDPGTNRPLVWVETLRCDSYAVGDASAATKISAIAAVVESPDGMGCLSAIPAVGDLQGDALPFCNGYLLWDATDNPMYAEFLRSGTPDFPIQVTHDLSFTEGELDPLRAGAPYQFRAGPSAPFQLVCDLVIRDRPGGGPFTASFWADTAAGTVKLSFSLHDVEFGEASGTVRTAPGSQLAGIFGGEVAQPAPGFSMISAFRWSHGTLTKTVIR